ncbi:MAG: ABC transporter permease [Limnochordia bacterium]
MSTLVKTWEYVLVNQGDFVLALRDHLFLLVVVPVLLGTIVAVPLGIAATRWRPLEVIILSVVSTLQTIPSLAMIAVMIPLGLGIGYRPAVVAIFLYSLLPIVRNTYAGINGVDGFLKEAATGMGMTAFQRLVRVELPLAAPMIMAGIRTATVIAVGTGTLAALVGGGGLGQYIVRGLNLIRDYIILAGALPAAIMALLADWLLGKVELAVTPRGLKLER